MFTQHVQNMMMLGEKSLAAKVASILRKYGTDAHVYLPGIGVINGLTAGNYLDSAGTTAATVDNPVGLVLDAAGSVGGELVTNGGFNTDTNWTKGTGWTISGGTANAVSASSAMYQASIGTSTKTYKVTFTVSNYVSGWVYTSLLGTAIPNISAVGTYSYIVKNTNGDSYLYLIGANFTGSIDNISVKEVTGIHATQSTTANKPILRRGAVNLLTYSEQFDNAAWVKGNATVTANQITAPDGTLTADKLVESAINAAHTIDETVPMVLGTIYTTSVHVKAGERTKLSFRADNDNSVATFDLATNTFSGVTNATATSTDKGDGWYRISLTYTGAGTGNRLGLRIRMVDALGNTSYLGDGTSGIYIWGAQLELGSTASTYAPTTTAPASSPTGNYHWVHDSTDVLTATFPAGYEAATIINTAETGQVTYTGQNIVGTYDMRGAVIGSELIINGGFDTDTNWIKVGNATVSGGTGNLNGNGAQAFLFQANVLTSGVFYKVTFDIVSITGTLNVWDNSGVALATYTTTGTKTFYFTHAIADKTFVFRAALGNNVASVDNVSVRQASFKEYARFIFRTGLTASELTIMQQFANRLAGV